MSKPVFDAPTYPHGFVTGRYLTAVADGSDADRLMDFTPAKGRITFTPERVIRRHEGPSPALVVQRPVECALDDQGYLTSPGGGRDVALIAGIYTVRFEVQGAKVPGPQRIEVKATHTEDVPLDLVLAMPEVVPPGSVVVVDETTAQRAEAAAARAEAVKAQAEAAAERVEAVLEEMDGIGGVGVPIFETLAEAEAWEAENPGRKALTLESSTPETPEPETPEPETPEPETPEPETPEPETPEPETPEPETPEPETPEPSGPSLPWMPEGAKVVLSDTFSGGDRTSFTGYVPDNALGGTLTPTPYLSVADAFRIEGGHLVATATGRFLYDVGAKAGDGKGWYASFRLVEVPTEGINTRSLRLRTGITATGAGNEVIHGAPSLAHEYGVYLAADGTIATYLDGIPSEPETPTGSVGGPYTGLVSAKITRAVISQIVIAEVPA